MLVGAPAVASDGLTPMTLTIRRVDHLHQTRAGGRSQREIARNVEVDCPVRGLKEQAELTRSQHLVHERAEAGEKEERGGHSVQGLR
jgi:hypothetical protein